MENSFSNYESCSTNIRQIHYQGAINWIVLLYSTNTELILNLAGAVPVSLTEQRARTHDVSNNTMPIQNKQRT